MTSSLPNSCSSPAHTAAVPWAGTESSSWNLETVSLWNLWNPGNSPLWNLVGFTWLAQLGSEDLPWMLFGILRNPPSRAVETELVIRITAAAPVLVGWRMLFQTCFQCFHQSWTQPLPFLHLWTCLTSSFLDPHPPLPKPFHTNVIWYQIQDKNHLDAIHSYKRSITRLRCNPGQEKLKNDGIALFPKPDVIF